MNKNINWKTFINRIVLTLQHKANGTHIYLRATQLSGKGKTALRKYHLDYFFFLFIATHVIQSTATQTLCNPLFPTTPPRATNTTALGAETLRGIRPSIENTPEIYPT